MEEKPYKFPKIRTVPLTVFGAVRQRIALFTHGDDYEIGIIEGPDARKDAEEIRIRCNSHAALLESLDHCRRELEFISQKPDGFDYEKHGLLDMVRAAIAKAKAEQS